MMKRRIIRTSPAETIFESYRQVPVIAAYVYFGFRHTYQRKSLIFRHPDPALSTAENFL